MAVDRKQVIEWFVAPEPKMPILGVIFGLAVAFVGSKASGALIAVGAAIIGVVVAIYLSAKARYDARPSDSQMDEWLEEDLRALDRQALIKSGTDTTELVGEPVMVTGPKFWKVANARVLFRKGKDNVFRFSPVGANVINFTANQLISYSCALDISTGKPLNEGTDEYFYRDVVSVSTKTTSDTVTVNDKKIQFDAAETFQLTTSGGTSIEVVLSDAKLIEYMGGGGEIPTTRAERAIQTVRKMLREKKAGQS